MRHAPARLVFDGSVTANFDHVLIEMLDRSVSSPYAFLRQLGAALFKATRSEVTVLADGHVRLMVDYPSLGDYAEAAMQLDALKAMIEEDQGAGPADQARPKDASSE